MSKITPYESNLDEIVTDGFELSGVLTRQDEINELRTELAIERGCRIAAGGERDELRAKLAALERQEPVACVVVEPGYWSGGHFYKGSKPYIAYSELLKLHIGDKLYTAAGAAPKERP